MSVDNATIRYIMQKHWTMRTENPVFEYINIYTYATYTHEEKTYANAIVKKKKGKRMDNPQL